MTLVRQVRDTGSKLRVMGAGHSWTDAAMSNAHLVNLDRMDRIYHVDQQAGRITAGGGIRLNALIAELAARGLAMPNLGSISEQSIAGAISTGTHGTGLGSGNLASQVVGLRLVTGTGDVLDVTSETPGELLNAARVSLGCLGVITRVTLAVVPMFNLHERTWTISVDEAVRDLEFIARQADHVKLWWLPHTGNVQVFAYERTDAATTPKWRYADRLDRWVNETLFQAVLNVTRDRPSWIPTLNRLIGRGYFGNTQRIARSDQCFNVAMPAKHLELEYAVDVAAAAELLDRTRDLITRQSLRVNFVQELRFAASDDAWLSPAFGRDSCHFGAYMGTTPQQRDYFEGVEALALERGGRPHWGKMFYADGHRVLQEFPRAGDFRAAMKRLDPDTIFGNAFTARLFGDGSSS